MPGEVHAVRIDFQGVEMEVEALCGPDDSTCRVLTVEIGRQDVTRLLGGWLPHIGDQALCSIREDESFRARSAARRAKEAA